MTARRASGGPVEPRRRGRLSHEDMTLWAEVVRTASPMHGQSGLRSSTSLGRSAPQKADPPGREWVGPGKMPARPKTPAPVRPAGDPTPVGRPEPGLDRRTAERIRRGERSPDAKLDLHGLTAERAHRSLDAFMAGAAASGQRLLLIITGKGRSGRGLLRDAVPGWLRAGVHRSRILGIWQAHQRHGGAGALYVYLKKPR